MAEKHTADGHYHLHVHTISKLKGHAIQAAAAYRRAERFVGEPAGQFSITQAAAYRHAQAYGNEGRVWDYRRKMGVAWTGLFAPDCTPDELLNSQTLWNTVERIETRKDARLAREMIIALPHQVDLDVHIAMLRTFITHNLVRRGMVADVAIHRPPVEHGGDPRNWHAHVLLTDRPMTAAGFAMNKDRTWNARENILLWRKAWADVHNATMEQLGLPHRITHLSLAAQREEALARGDALAALDLDREPQIHVGKAHHARHPKFVVYADRRTKNEGILTRNKDAAGLRAARMRDQIAMADRDAHDESRQIAHWRDTWPGWDNDLYSVDELERHYGRPEPRTALGRYKAAALRTEASAHARKLSRAHGHPWHETHPRPDAPSLFDVLRPLVAKTGPGHPVFKVTAKDIVFAFYALGMISQRNLQTSLEHIAVEEQHLFEKRQAKRKAKAKLTGPLPPKPRPAPPTFPTPKATKLANLRQVAHRPEAAYLTRLEQLAAFQKRHQAARQTRSRSNKLGPARIRRRLLGVPSSA